MTEILYGFQPPGDKDVVFKVSGALEDIRLLDQAARELFSGAVQSHVKDGARHEYAEKLESAAKGVASATAYCQERRWLRPAGWALGRAAFPLARASIRAKFDDLNKREFVTDADGNYTLMFSYSGYEHLARSVASQLRMRIISERFPEGCYREPKRERERREGESYTFTITLNNVTTVIDLLA